MEKQDDGKIKILTELKGIFRDYDLLILYILGVVLGCALYSILPESITPQFLADKAAIEKLMYVALIIGLSGLWWLFAVPFMFIIHKFLKIFRK